MNRPIRSIDTNLDLVFANTTYGEMERRSALRLDGPFLTTVRGQSLNGQQFEEHTQLINMSAMGLCVGLERRLELGATVFVAVRLTLDAGQADYAPGVAVRGVILRIQHCDGGWAHAMLFTQHRFLFAAPK